MTHSKVSAVLAAHVAAAAARSACFCAAKAMLRHCCTHAPETVITELDGQSVTARADARPAKPFTATQRIQSCEDIICEGVQQMERLAHLQFSPNACQLLHHRRLPRLQRHDPAHQVCR